ncbi:MAG: c-type cytochrome [Alcaligenaceae bacterium]|nr:c-type cytochrome [Alcaligenaceae bacterium]
MKHVISKIVMACGLALGVASGAAVAQTAVGPVKPDIERGQQLYMTGDPARGITTCIACHGMDGVSLVPIYPHIAGQSYEYILAQLKNFKVVEGTNQSHRRTQNAMLMAPNVVQMTEQEMADLALFVSSLELTSPAIAEMAADQEMVQRGRQIWRGGIADRNVPACASCHGADGHGIPGQYPRLSGQIPSYLAEQLIAFADGERDNAGTDNHMAEIANRMSRQDIKAVADYAAGIR